MARLPDSDGLTGAGLLIVDKPGGLTSHDVVARCRKLLNTRKVGHAGTLDPMATGVLVLGVERATKMLGLLSLTTKAYSATIRLGLASTTDDAEGELLGGSDTSGLTAAALTQALATLTGAIQQVPATVSAIKVDGQRAHVRVRAGEQVDLPARTVTVSQLRVCSQRRATTAEGRSVLDLDVDVECSSGTYVRALARDLGAALEVGGHLTALRRTRVGCFSLAQAQTLTQLAEHPVVSLDLDGAVRAAFPTRAVSAEEAESISQGRWLDPVGIDGVYAAIDPTDHAVALLEESGGRARTVMVVRPATLRAEHLAKHHPV
ncbi:MAG: tRNA pseudouridine(55) synthase TruB [Mycobacteriaceae bacterium]